MGRWFWLRVLALYSMSGAVASLGLLVVTATPAYSYPAGSGGCSAATLACYPECRFEWTGSAGGGVSGQPADTGYCPYPVAHPDVIATDQVDAITIAGTVPVTVSGTVPVSGSVNVTNPAGQRLDVDALCESGAPCVANSAQADTVTIANEGFDATTVRIALTMLGMIAAALVGNIVFRSVWR